MTKIIFLIAPEFLEKTRNKSMTGIIKNKDLTISYCSELDCQKILEDRKTEELSSQLTKEENVKKAYLEIQLDNWK